LVGWSQGIVIPRSTTGVHAPSVVVSELVVVVSASDAVGGTVGAGVVVVESVVVGSCVGSSRVTDAEVLSTSVEVDAGSVTLSDVDEEESESVAPPSSALMFWMRSPTSRCTAAAARWRPLLTLSRRSTAALETPTRARRSTARLRVRSIGGVSG
jgi:hypothetical protein